MLSDRHKEITRSALGTLTLHNDALTLICTANADSDSLGKDGGYSVNDQHFCTNKVGTSATAIQDSLRFYRDAVEVAGEFVESGWSATDSPTAGDNFDKALYSFGRACHCIQDFYAHSNWVALRRNEVWHGRHFYGLFVCLPTKLNQLHRNVRGFTGWNMDKSQQYVNLMKLTERSHPDIQLDYRESTPSIALEFAGVTVGPGYDRARKLAIKHTVQIWGGFTTLLNQLIQKQPNFLQTKLSTDFFAHKPKKYKLATLRKAFNWAMEL